MELRSTFQSIISLHQEELPFALQERSTQLPLDGNRIVTVTGIRRCGKSSLLGLTIHRLLQQGIPKERILYVGFDDEVFFPCRPKTSMNCCKLIVKCILIHRLRMFICFLMRYNS